jgi:hypothetical protein
VPGSQLAEENSNIPTSFTASAISPNDAQLPADGLQNKQVKQTKSTSSHTTSKINFIVIFWKNLKLKLLFLIFNFFIIYFSFEEYALKQLKLFEQELLSRIRIMLYGDECLLPPLIFSANLDELEFTKVDNLLDLIETSKSRLYDLK